MTGRVYHILHMLPDLQMGGGQMLLLRNISFMDRQRFQNFVCYIKPVRELEGRYSTAGFRPTCLEHCAGRGGQTLVDLVRLVRRRRVDLVHTNNTAIDRTYGEAAAVLCRVPVVNTLHSILSPASSRWESRVGFRATARRRLRNCFRAAACGQLTAKIKTRALSNLAYWRTRLVVRRIIAVSESVRASWSRRIRLLGIPEEWVSVVYPGLPIEYVASRPCNGVLESLRRELGISRGDPVLITVGRMSEDKDHKRLIPMMQRVVQERPGAKLLIIGEGPERARLEQAIREVGLSHCVVLVGRRDDVHSLLAISDVFVFPSSGEGFGLAVLEAMGASKPVVAFKVPALTEFVEDTLSGYLVEPGNAQAMASKVLNVLENPERARLMGEHGRRVVRERFDAQASVRALERVYLSILEPPPGRGGKT